MENQEVVKGWNKLDNSEKLEVIEQGIDCCSVSEGSLFVRVYRDGSVCAYIQAKADNHLMAEAVSQDTLATLFDADHDFEEEDALVILNWMNDQI
jgi:hypothetical protein